MFNKRGKGTFETQNNLKTTQIFRLETDPIAEISHANDILPRLLQGAPWYESLKSNENTIKTL